MTQPNTQTRFTAQRSASRPKPASRPADWRPEPSSLSREEPRRIVLKAIG